MNNRDKLQKFSIRKYAIGTFSTVIATLVFMGINTNHASADELNQNQKLIKQLNQTDDDSNTHSQEIENNKQNSAEQTESLRSSTSLNQANERLSDQIKDPNETSQQLPTNVSDDSINQSHSETNMNNESLQVDSSTMQAHSKKVSDSDGDASENEHHKLTENVLAESRASKNGKEKENLQEKDKPQQVQPPLDKNALQAFFDASYHNYRMIDRDRADTTEYQKVKSAFDYVNDLLGNNQNIPSEQLVSAYQQLEKALELARTLPQRSTTEKRGRRSTRSVVEERSAGQDRGRSAYLEAKTEYYVNQNDDGSSYPTGTFLHASNRRWPYNLPGSRNILHASDVRRNAYITTKRVKDGYQWDVLFNNAHRNHDYMIYWFGIPRDQNPTGPVTLTVINRDGTSTSSGGVGFGSGQPLPTFWQTAGAIKPGVATDFKHGSASGYPFYDGVNNFYDFARGGGYYFDREGASSTAVYYGDQNFEMLNGQKLDQIQGLDTIYSFIGRGDASYRISFKTEGLPTTRLYYAAGARSGEYRQSTNYNQLYVEPLREYQDRVANFIKVKDRTLHLGRTNYTYDPELGKDANRAILDSDGDHNIIDYADDPLSYVKNISDIVMGFMPPDAPYDQSRVFGVNTLYPNQIEELFSKHNLEEAARTGNPIRLMIGFNAYDRKGNPETLVPVKLYVKPALKQTLTYWHNDEGKSMDTYTESKNAGHPVYQVMAGNIHNNSPQQQDIRIRITSNEPIKDNDWAITNYPSTLRLEDAVQRTNNTNERNFALVGTLLPGDYYITVRLGDREDVFEVRAKPSPPRITTTAIELKGKAGQKPNIVVSGLPPVSNAKVLLVTGGQNGETDAFSDPYSKPVGYTVIASTNTNRQDTVTFQASDYLQTLPRSGEIKAITYINDEVQSNFSNSITLITDDAPPTIGDPVGLKSKYYRDDTVSFTVPVSDNQGGSGVKQVTVEGLPSSWTQSFEKSSNGQTGTLRISGTISHSQAFNSSITLRLSASDNDNNVTTGNQIKTININVGTLATDFPPVPLSNGNRVVVVNPSNISRDENAIAKDRLATQNTGRNNVLAISNTFIPQNNGSFLVNYKDGSQATMNEGNIFTYEPIRKNQYSEASVNDNKIATLYVPKGSRYTINRDLRTYFALSNGQDIPNTTFTLMAANDTLPTPEQIAQFGDETHDYRIMAFNAYNKGSENLTLRIKAIDIVAPTGNAKVYRVNPITLTNDEIEAVKQAFVNANPKLRLQTSNIDVNNPTNNNGVSTVTVTVHKDQYTKSFVSNERDLNFLRWTNIRDNYTVGWSNSKIEGRTTDEGLSWSPDHKSIIYRYDATKGTGINLNQALKLFNATTNVPGLRNNISGNDKLQAEAGGAAYYNISGFSKTTNRDGQQSYTKNGQLIQVLDLVESGSGNGGTTVSHSNRVYTERNAQVVNGTIPAANQAAEFAIEKVIKSNDVSNGIMGVIYKAQLFLTPYQPKTYIERTGSSINTTNNVYDVYFVPSDHVDPTIQLGDYSHNEIFSGETFRNTMTIEDNFGVQSTSVPNDSAINVTTNNTFTQLTGTAPNVNSQTTKTVKIIATDKSNNQARAQFNVVIKPLKDKYTVTTSATNANPIRLNNIQNGATLSSSERQAVLNSIIITKSAPTRAYASDSVNEIRTKEVSRVIRPRNDATVIVTVTYSDGTTNQISVPVKHVLPEVLSEMRFTVKGQNFPEGKGANPKDFFKLRDGSPLNARVNWVNNGAPNINSNQIGVSQPLNAEIWFDGETLPIHKSTSYKVVQSSPKRIFETTINGKFVDQSDSPGFAGSYIKGVDNSWPGGMNFDWAQGSSAPNSSSAGSFVRKAVAIYSNGQREEVKILFKVKPNKPVIDQNSLIAKGGLSGQQVIVRNVPNDSTITLYKSNGTAIPNTTTQISNGVATVTIAGELPTGSITAQSSVTTNQLNYNKVINQTVTEVTEDITVTSDKSDQANVTVAMQVKNGGIKFIKGTNFNFNDYSQFISNIPANSRSNWTENPDTWKGTIGQTTKTVNVTLSNNQGTRTIDVPIIIYPTVIANDPIKDIKGRNLVRGTDVYNYITFEGNNRYGGTATWKDNRQPDKNSAGIQNLTAVVNYPGITTSIEIPVKVWVYNFNFPQPVYKIEIGQTFPGGTWIGNYHHLENGDGLSTTGLSYYWNQASTGSNNTQWQSLAYTRNTFVKTGRYDILLNNHDWVSSETAKFIVTNAQPNKPGISQLKNGNIIITPGSPRKVNISGTSDYVDAIADKIVINKNGRKLTTFIKNNNGHWEVQQGEPDVRGIGASNDGSQITLSSISVAMGDTIDAIASTGSGETVSPTAHSDQFIVKAPQPEQVSINKYDNGTMDILPDNTRNTINPTERVEISYTEKSHQSNEISKSFTITKNSNGKWSINNKPDYVEFNSDNGKVVFSANTIKPNSQVTITSKAGTGNVENTNPLVISAPAEHVITINPIIKEQGQNVSNDDVNNAVNVANKRQASIKRGTSLPTNLAGGSTTEIPVTIFYNDNSSEQITEIIKTKVNKTELINARHHLDETISKENKTPSSIRDFDQAMERAQAQINTAKNEADQVINTEFATPQQVNNALSKVKAAQTKIDEAKSLLQNRADNNQLITAKNQLQNALQPVVSTEGMTQSSAQNYTLKRQNAEQAIENANRVINNGDASTQDIANAKIRVEQAEREYNEAKSNLRADKSQLQTAYDTLNRNIETNDKKPASVDKYNQSLDRIRNELNNAKNAAILALRDSNPSVATVREALRKINEVQPKVDQAIGLLEQKANNSQLVIARDQLQSAINPESSTTGMTKESARNYVTKLEVAKQTLQDANGVINDGNASVQQISDEITKVNQAKNNLNQAKSQLTADVTQLQDAVRQLDRRGDTQNKKPNSVNNYQRALQAIENNIQRSKNNANAIIQKPIRSVNEVKQTLQEVQQLNNQLTSAIDQLQSLANNSGLKAAKNKLESKINENILTDGMTTQSIQSFNNAKNAARTEIQTANGIINDGNASDQDISTEINKLQQKYNSLVQSITD
ncbi:hyperosmolarity resistance protein Ebh [Staphylococcus epidermidis]